MADQLDEQLKVTVEAPADADTTEEIGNYRVLRLLGRGGMGAVYEVEHKLLNQRYALKILSPDRIPDANIVERFRAEAKAISALEHPGLLRIYEFGISDKGQPYLVTDLFDGKPLSDGIREEGELPTSTIAQVMLQATAALGHAHERGVIHRDIKPSNILAREKDGNVEVKIIDFGIAKQQESSNGVLPAPTLTATGELIGTPQYMSPEQCQGFKLDARSDIYSLGCVLYQMLTGRPPFDGANFMAIMLGHMNEVPKEIRSTDKVRQALGVIALRCLAKDRESRYQSMDALAEELNAALAGTNIRAHRFRKQQQGSFQQRLRVYIPLAVLGVVGALIAASYELWAPNVVLYMNLPPAVKQMIMDPGQAAELQAAKESDRLRNESLRADMSLDVDKLALAENLLRPHAVGEKPWNIDAANKLAAILAIEGKLNEMQLIVEEMSGHVPLNIAQNLHSTAVAIDHGGFHAQSWPLMLRSYKMYRRLVGETDPRTVKELYNMATASYNAGNNRRALQEFKDVLPFLKNWNPSLENQTRAVIAELEQKYR